MDQEIYHPIKSELKPAVGDIVIVRVSFDDEFLEFELAFYTGSMFIHKNSLEDITHLVRDWTHLP